MIYATPDMLPFDVAQAAHSGTSFVPDKRAKQEQDELARVINANCDELSRLAITPAQREAFEEWAAQYVREYVARTVAYLRTRAGCVSTMIAGPSGFNVRRAEKANNAERRRAEDFMEWHRRTLERGRKAIRDLTPAETIEAEAKALIVSQVESCYRTFCEIKRGEARGFDPRAFSSSAAGYIQRAAKNGESTLVAAALDHIRTRQGETGIVMFTPRNSVWNLGETAQAAEEAEAARPTGSETDWKGDGFEVVKNWDIDRLQIHFDAKPGPDMIASLKRAGWRWSPREGAWQRQLTQNARYSARDIVGKP